MKQGDFAVPVSRIRKIERGLDGCALARSAAASTRRKSSIYLITQLLRSSTVFHSFHCRWTLHTSSRRTRFRASFPYQNPLSEIFKSFQRVAGCVYTVIISNLFAIFFFCHLIFKYLEINHSLKSLLSFTQLQTDKTHNYRLTKPDTSQLEALGAMRISTLVLDDNHLFVICRTTHAGSCGFWNTLYCSGQLPPCEGISTTNENVELIDHQVEVHSDTLQQDGERVDCR